MNIAINKPAFLAAAEQHCHEKGVKLTEIRRDVLALALEYTGIVKAYQLLNDLQIARINAAPPTVYRALDFLVEQGLLHKIEALNGFLVCRHFDCLHEALILVCQNCGAIEEVHDKTVAFVRQQCQPHGFLMQLQNIVIHGLCQLCVRPNQVTSPIVCV